MQEHIKINEEGIKSILNNLFKISKYAEDCIANIQTAFIYNNSKPLRDCEIKIDIVRKLEAQIARSLTEAAAGNLTLKPYVSASIQLLRVWENLGKLSEQVKEKISRRILFSDRAVNESVFLLQRLEEILRPTSDLILGKNSFLVMYIRESQISIEKMAEEYATFHENRLVTGECLQEASLIYINMLEAIRSIAWHSREIAGTLVS